MHSNSASGLSFYSLVAVVVASTFIVGCSTPPQNTASEPRVVASIEFASSTLIGPVTQNQLTNWWQQKLKIGSDEADAYEFLTLSSNGQDKRIRVETCADYTNALNQGAVALDTSGMTMQGWFQRAAGTMKFIGQAHPSTHPLPAYFLARLPVSLIGWHGSDEEAQIVEDTRNGITLKDYARSGKVKNLKLERHQVSFQTEGRDFWIEELARGDVDGDGFEDTWIFVTWHYQEGSGRGYELQVWSRNKLSPFHLDWQR